jgi:hypothetical protein
VRKNSVVRNKQIVGAVRRDCAKQLSEMDCSVPHNIDAERSVLGAIFLDNCVLNAAIEIIHSEDFFLPQHRITFGRMIQLGKNGEPIDVVTLSEDLSRHDELDAAGGVAYLSQLADGLPRVTNVGHYARIVKEKSNLRSIAYSAIAIERRALGGGEPASSLAGSAAEDFLRIAERSTLRNWRERFHRVDELPAEETNFLIDRILPEGITFLGALSGVGKTWFALSMTRALTTGRKLLGVWDVPELVEVLYLCPEMSAKTFKKRCLRFGISERFRCQTIADGTPLNLDDPLLAAAIRELRPVVFLDTAIRFSNAEDENSAADNQELARAIFSLIYAGARAIVCLHHRAKDAAKAEEMTLENTLRGTGDLGAVAAAVYGLRYDQLTRGNAAYLKESRRLVRLIVRCVKARDFVPIDDFRIQLDPYIDTIGDMAVLTDKIEDSRETEAEKVERAISMDTKTSLRHIAVSVGVSKDRVKRLAAERGWYQGESCWSQKNS